MTEIRLVIFKDSVEEGMDSDCLMGIGSSLVVMKIFWN